MIVHDDSFHFSGWQHKQNFLNVEASEYIVYFHFMLRKITGGCQLTFLIYLLNKDLSVYFVPGTILGKTEIIVNNHMKTSII
jgi:hypothetical protein